MPSREIQGRAVFGPAAAILIGLGTAAMIAGPAAAQYRSDQPAVLAAPDTKESEFVEIDEVSAMMDFNNAYSNVGKPRMALFWNREFSDRLSQWVAFRRAVSSGSTTIEGPLFGTGNAANIQKSETAQTEVLVQDQVRGGLGDELTNLRFESAYVEPMQSAGAIFIDRATIMRLNQSHTGKQQGVGYRPDKQAVETDALVGYADMIAEILMTPDGREDSPLGMAFRVKITDVRTGQLVLSFLSQGMHEDDTDKPAQFVTTSTGFARKAPEPPKPEDVAHRLALETMVMLSRRWGI